MIYIVVFSLLLMMTVPQSTGAEKKVVRVGIAISDTLPYFEGVMKPEFEALYPDIELQFEYLSWTVDRYITAYIGGNPPDVFHVGGDKLGAYLDMVTPINDYAGTW